MNWPSGPLWLGDRFGLDNVVAVLKQRKDETGCPDYEPDPLLLDMLSQGRLGVKSGSGFYPWRYEKHDYGVLLYEKRHDHAFLRMTRPDKLNALNERLWESLRLGLARAKEDLDVRAVVLTGQGRAFCAGDDIAMMEGWRSAIDAKEWAEAYAAPLFKELAAYEKPLIALIDGIASGGGCEIALMADIVLASHGSTFSIPEGLIGAFPPIAVSYGVGFTSKHIGRYALTSEWMDAAMAERLGIVSQLVPTGQLEPAAQELVLKIVKAAPLGIQAAKRTINAVRSLFMTASDYGLSQLLLLSGSRDFAEGMRAFLTHRPLSWEGK